MSYVLLLDYAYKTAIEEKKNKNGFFFFAWTVKDWPMEISVKI